MKKTILLLSVLLIAFSLIATDRDPMALSNYGPSLAYFWAAPNQYGDVEQGVQYTAPADCTLSSWELYLYSIVGTPPSIVVHVYDDNAGEPGTELGSVTVPTANLVTYTTGWSTIDLTSLNLAFTAGDVFYITYTVTLGSYGIAEVQWLSDDGTYAATSTTFQGNGTSWLSMGAGWGTNYEMYATANVETSGVVGPILSLNYDSYNFGQTAIGGYKYDTVTITNAGGGSLVVQDVALTGNADFSVYDPNADSYPLTLGSSENTLFYIEYTPSATGAVTGNIAITINDREVHNIPLSGEGYIHNSWADAGAIYAQSPAGNQGDNPWSMSTSDLAPGYLHAESFEGLTANIASMDFWGINWYHDGSGWVPVDTEDPMTFEIKFYDFDDATGRPGTVIETHTPTITRETVADSLFSNGPVYKYHFELPAELAMTDGWVSIEGTSVGTPDDAWFMWSTSPIGDGFNANWDDTNTEWDWDDNDLAFALYPSTAIDPPQNVSLVMNGIYPEIFWTDVPGLVQNIYRAEELGARYTVVGTVSDGAGSFLDTSATARNYFYFVTNNTALTRRQQMSIDAKFRRLDIRPMSKDAKISK